ncbi:MAG: stage II sporulation protein D [Syntrophomonadaceae bacterium]
MIITLMVLIIIPVFFILEQINILDTYYKEPQIKLYLKQENQVIKLSIEEYIIGTVAAEMPASFEEEALKAQAVCARTYALRKILDNKPYPYDADLSDDINSCQAFITEQEFYKRHPNSKKLFQKIKRAVAATRGEIMIYNQEPIDALYHSTCGGSTESAINVWGNDVPYLRSVKCGYCMKSNYYNNVMVFSIPDFNKSLGLNGDKLTFNVAENTPSGRIKKIVISGVELSGEKLRQILGLPSTWVGLRINESKVEVHSRGYGHGLGLCQYGANGMASKGKNYHQILRRYYQKIQFTKLNYE